MLAHSYVTQYLSGSVIEACFLFVSDNRGGWMIIGRISDRGRMGINNRDDG
jgi:hypothetical protein